MQERPENELSDEDRPGPDSGLLWVVAGYCIYLLPYAAFRLMGARGYILGGGMTGFAAAALFFGFLGAAIAFRTMLRSYRRKALLAFLLAVGLPVLFGLTLG